MKRLLIWAGILAALLGPANAAGTVPGFSLTPQFDNFGKVMPGCRLYVIQAGTTQTPQNSYQDSALTNLQPNPLSCDATGRLPQFFVADGQIKVRLTNAAGVQQFVGDNLLVVGASSGGGGGGGTVDPTTVLQTGDVKARWGTGNVTGFVRMNGQSIGSATSGANERANADCQALFEYLWNTDPNLSVSGGRGGSANSDWVANKRINLPDARGRVLASLDDMGNFPAGRLTTSYFGAGPTTLGSATGSESRMLFTPNMPPYTPSGAITNGAITVTPTGPYSQGVDTSVGALQSAGSTARFGPLSLVASQAPSSFAGNAQGGTSTPFAILPPMLVLTTYMKL